MVAPATAYSSTFPAPAIDKNGNIYIPEAGEQQSGASLTVRVLRPVK